MAGVNRDQNLAALKRRLIIRRVKAVLISVFLFSLVAFAIWYIREGDFFQLRGIEISGTKSIPDEEIKKYFTERKNNLFLAKVLKEDNVLPWFLIDGEGISSRYPRIEEADILRNILKRTVEVSVKEKDEKFIWCSESPEERSCYWLDDSGQVFAAAPDAEGELVKVIYDRAARPIEIGGRPLSSAEIVNLKKMISLSEKWSWGVDAIYLKSAELNDIFFVLNTGQEIYFNLDVDPSSGDPIIAALNDSDEWASVEYLDLRISGKGFYKLR